VFVNTVFVSHRSPVARGCDFTNPGRYLIKVQKFTELVLLLYFVL